MNRRLFLVLNPRSGRASVKRRITDIIEVFGAEEYEVTVHVTRHKGDAADRIRERGMNFDLIVCCGGDGTVKESFEALSFMPNAPPLGIIPTGTTNDYANSLSMPNDPVEAARTICNGTPFDCDCGMLGGQVFAFAAAFGIFTDITYETPQANKNQLGRAAYILEAIKNLPSYSPYHITADCEQGRFEGEYILGMVTNTISIGGFKNIFLPVAKLNDGLLELTLLKAPKTLADYQQIANILLGMERVGAVPSDMLTVVSTDRVHIKSSDSISWTLDGEEGGAYDETIVEALPCAVSVITAEGGVQSAEQPTKT